MVVVVVTLVVIVVLEVKLVAVLVVVITQAAIVVLLVKLAAVEFQAMGFKWWLGIIHLQQLIMKSGNYTLCRMQAFFN